MSLIWPTRPLTSNDNMMDRNDLEKNIREMTDDQMDTMLLELSDSPAWAAFLRYTRGRENEVLAACSMLDPVKEPTMLARAQGRGVGLNDLFRHVEMLERKRLKKD